ncbi:MAG: cyclic nucleotide-binding domain-containing protein [Defluviitaleaceae bacterium]|nr:cyclic nucleotide-binding domain-containing protein [Defluviitaleaceae bacterium]
MIDISQFKNHASIKMFSDSAIIIREGDTSPHSMYIVLKGSVGVYKNYLQPDQVTVAHLKSGEFFGEMSLFLLQPRSATVVALDDIIALEINKDNVYSIIEKYPDVALSMVSTLCIRVNELNQLLKKTFNADPSSLIEKDSNVTLAMIRTLCSRVSDLNQLLKKDPLV